MQDSQINAHNVLPSTVIAMSLTLQYLSVVVVEKILWKPFKMLAGEGTAVPLHTVKLKKSLVHVTR